MGDVTQPCPPGTPADAALWPVLFIQASHSQYCARGSTPGCGVKEKDHGMSSPPTEPPQASGPPLLVPGCQILPAPVEVRPLALRACGSVTIRPAAAVVLRK